MKIKFIVTSFIVLIITTHTAIATDTFIGMYFKSHFLRIASDWEYNDAPTYPDFAKTKLRETRLGSSSRIHEAKSQGAGLAPYVTFASDISKSFVSFVSDHNTSYAQDLADYWLEYPQGPYVPDRSEIRIVGSEAYFNSDTEAGDMLYSNIRFRIDPISDYHLIENDEVNNEIKNDWAAIWQCAQHHAGASPPISLHIENGALSVVTYQDFQPSLGLRDQQYLPQIEEGIWYDVRIRYNLGTYGSYAVWLNGQRLYFPADNPADPAVDTKRIPMGYKNARNPTTGTRACRLSYGLYRNSAPGYFKIDFRQVTVDNEYHSIQ